MSKSYKELVVWKKSNDLILKIYQVTKNYPQEEVYGLISQMRRAVISINANIVEGHGKRYLGEYIKFISTSIGSSNELSVYLNLSKDLHYLNQKKFTELNSQQVEISKMLFGLRNSLMKKQLSRNKSKLHVNL